MKISASIVLYKTSPEELKLAASSFFKTEFQGEQILYLIDNSPTMELEKVLSDPRIVYIHTPENKGFGYAHNIAFKKAISEKSSYHFVINPDISTKDDVITPMVDYLESNIHVGMMMPQIKHLNGEIQYLPKLLPSPFSIIYRKIGIPKKRYKKFLDKYELRNVNQAIIYKAPILSGCFTLFRLAALDEIGFYDDNFFMYFEDWDLSRRVNTIYDTIYFPKVSVFHEYNSGANHNTRLLKIFVKSAIYYFNKWGWFFDNERVRVNKQTLLQFEEK